MPHQCEALQLDHTRGVQQLGGVTVRAIAYAPRSLQRALTLGVCISSCIDISLVRRVLCTNSVWYLVQNWSVCIRDHSVYDLLMEMQQPTALSNV